MTSSRTKYLVTAEAIVSFAVPTNFLLQGATLLPLSLFGEPTIDVLLVVAGCLGWAALAITARYVLVDHSRSLPLYAVVVLAVIGLASVSAVMTEHFSKFALNWSTVFSTIAPAACAAHLLWLASRKSRSETLNMPIPAKPAAENGSRVFSGERMSSRAKWLWLLAVLATEFAAVWSAYETEGEITMAMYFVAFMFNLVLVPLVWKKPRWGLPLFLGLWLGLVPYSAWRELQLMRATAEAERIVEFVLEEQRRTGRVPTTLGDYRFRDSGIRDGIFSYEASDEKSFRLRYGPPGNEWVAHWYSTETGWGYYPD